MSDLFDVSGETILVTGASQGLGRHFAELLAGGGASVVLAARQKDKLASLEQDIRAHGGRAMAVALDVTDRASVAASLDAAEAAFGPVTVLINNAGVTVENFAVDETEANWDFVMNTNLKGVYFLSTEVARRLIARQKAGNIINIASIISFAVMKTLSLYGISKAGVAQLTKALAVELASRNIRVNALAPGYIDTDMTHDFWSTPAGERMIKAIPQRRVGAVSDLDGAIMFLASKASRYMTGSVVTVDGGLLLG